MPQPETAGVLLSEEKLSQATGLARKIWRSIKSQTGIGEKDEFGLGVRFLKVEVENEVNLPVAIIGNRSFLEKNSKINFKKISWPIYPFMVTESSRYYQPNLGNLRNYQELEISSGLAGELTKRVTIWSCRGGKNAEITDLNRFGSNNPEQTVHFLGIVVNPFWTCGDLVPLELPLKAMSLVGKNGWLKTEAEIVNLGRRLKEKAEVLKQEEVRRQALETQKTALINDWEQDSQQVFSGLWEKIERQFPEEAGVEFSLDYRRFRGVLGLAGLNCRVELKTMRVSEQVIGKYLQLSIPGGGPCGNKQRRGCIQSAKK